jgi:hypothetical protein
MESLGLHNKPKAEVHLGHKLTGPKEEEEEEEEEETSPRQRPHNLHETYQSPRVQLITPDDGHRRCPKHVEFRDKIKFWVLDASFWLFVRSLSRCTVT